MYILFGSIEQKVVQYGKMSGIVSSKEGKHPVVSKIKKDDTIYWTVWNLVCVVASSASSLRH